MVGATQHVMMVYLVAQGQVGSCAMDCNRDIMCVLRVSCPKCWRPTPLLQSVSAQQTVLSRQQVGQLGECMPCGGLQSAGWMVCSDGMPAW